MAEQQQGPHSLDDLEAMARKHMRYELQRMAWCPTIKEGPIPSAPVVREAVLEAYLVHVRVVHEFSTKVRRPATDQDSVLGGDYFDDPSVWEPKVLFPSGEVKHLHRRLAHLGVMRLQEDLPGGGFKWDRGRPITRWGRIALAEFTQFYKTLRRHHPDRANWFLEGYREARDALGA